MKTSLAPTSDWRWTLPLACCCILNAATATPAPPKPPPAAASERSDFLDLRPNGGYRFAYSTGDAGRHYHSAAATPDNTVAGRFGYRDPKTGADLQTTYTAGKRGFRVRGPHIARQMDLSQTKVPYNPPVSPDSSQYNPSYSTYFDPNEDPSYKFGFQTPTYTRSESSNSKGDVNGRYSFVDDVGVRHNVEYEAGSRVGFHVKTPYPDSAPLGPSVFFAGPPANKKGSKPVRGHTAIVRGKDGSYRFTSAGPDQRRTEVSDATGHVRGSYTYVDDKGVQRTTQYIAGPNIGYKVINTQTNNRYPVYPYLPSYPYVPPFKDPDGNPLPDDGLFDFNAAASASGVKPGAGAGAGAGPGGHGDKDNPDYSGEDGGDYGNSSEDSKDRPGGGKKPGAGGSGAVTGGGSDQTEDPWPNGDLFGPSTAGPTTTGKPHDGTGDGLFDGPGSNGGHHKDDNDDELFDFDDTPPKGDDSTPFLQTSSPPPSNIPYGNCCKLGPARGAAKFNTERRHTRKPDATSLSQSYSNVRDFSQGQDSDDFVGFPAGVPIRAHVQSLDLQPYGSRIPSPGTAIEHPEANKSRRQASEPESSSVAPRTQEPST